MISICKAFEDVILGGQSVGKIAKIEKSLSLKQTFRVMFDYVV